MIIQNTRESEYKNRLISIQENQKSHQKLNESVCTFPISSVSGGLSWIDWYEGIRIHGKIDMNSLIHGNQNTSIDWYMGIRIHAHNTCRKQDHIFTKKTHIFTKETHILGFRVQETLSHKKSLVWIYGIDDLSTHVFTQETTLFTKEDHIFTKETHVFTKKTHILGFRFKGLRNPLRQETHLSA